MTDPTIVNIEMINGRTISGYGLKFGKPGELVCFNGCNFTTCTGEITGTCIEFNNCTFSNASFVFVVKTDVSFNGCVGTLSLP